MANAIKNAELIENIFGKWPSFHDAKIHNILLARKGEYGPYRDVTIHHWLLTKEIDLDGYYVHTNHTLSTIRFSRVTDLVLTGFNHQNVLWELVITPINEANSPPTFAVTIPSSSGCEAAFKCKVITVLSATPSLQT